MSTATSRMRPRVHAEELVLGERRRLEVQSAQRAHGGREGMVVLNEVQMETGRLESRPVVDLREEPSRVAVLLRRHDLDRRDGGVFNLHSHAP